MFERNSGILMPVSSLNGEYGVGDFGKKAYEFVDFLEESGQKLWQILPMGQTGYGDSPYQSFSAFAGNPYFIDLDDLVEKGYLLAEELNDIREWNKEDKVDYGLLYYVRIPLLKKAYERFISKVDEKEVEAFKSENKYWLEDYCLFMALKERYDSKSWQTWPKAYKFRTKEAMKEAKASLSYEMGYYLFTQFIFNKHWSKLKSYANNKGIKIIGDIPIFIAGDSADAWSKEKLFDFNKYKKPKRVAGCPPDAFSADGQLWGNPLYNWEYMEKTGYDWWIKRIEACFKDHDIVRIDHFRGFESFWSIKAGAKTARKGRWEKGPGMKLFNAIKKSIGDVPIIAEDLGFLTPKVEKLLDDSGYPGMKILQFAFDHRDESDYLPHKYNANSIAYTGTHDNETVVGWYDTVDKLDREMCDTYLGKIKEVESKEINWKFIETTWESKSVFALTQTQELIGVGSEGRLNIPSTPSGNWQWRIKDGELTKEIAKRLKNITIKAKR